MSNTRYRPALPWEISAPVTLAPEFSSCLDFVIKNVNVQLVSFYDLSMQRLKRCVEQGNDIELKDVLKDMEKKTRRYNIVQSTLDAIGRHAMEKTIAALIDWRLGALMSPSVWTGSADSKQGKTLDEMKLYMTDYLFAKFALLLLHHWSKGNVLGEECSRNVIDLALDFFQSSTAKNDVPMLVSWNRDVFDLYTQIVGIISTHRYDQVSRTLFKELEKYDKRNPAEFAALCRGMRCIALPFRQQQHLMPYLDKKVKPELAAAVCKLIGNALIPLTALDDKEGDGQGEEEERALFRSAVTELYHHCYKLWKKFRDPSAGFVMETGILTVGEVDFFASQPFSVFEKVAKVCKYGDKLRVVGLASLFYLVLAVFLKLQDPKYNFDFDLLLMKLVHEIFPASSKKMVHAHVKSVDVAVDITSLLSVFRCEWVVHNIVVPALSSQEMNLERILIALQTFCAIADRIAICFDTSYLGEAHEHVAGVETGRKGTYLRLARKPNPGGRLSEDKLQRVCSAFGDFYQHVDAHVGGILLFQQGKQASEGTSKERHPLLAALPWCIQVIKRAPPTALPLRKTIANLVSYTFHVNDAVRTAAREAAFGYLMSRPLLRNMVLEEMARMVVSLPMTAEVHVLVGIEMLSEAMNTCADPKWINAPYDPIRIEAVDPSVLKQPRTFVACTLESVALCLLTYPSPKVRNAAMMLLKVIKRLDFELKEELKDGAVRVYDVLREHGNEIAVRAHEDWMEPSSNADSALETDLFKIASSNNVEKLWSNCLGRMISMLKSHCPSAAHGAFHIAAKMIENVTPTVMAMKGDRLSSDQAMLVSHWKDAIIVTVASGEGSTGWSFHPPVAHDCDQIYKITIPALWSTCSAVRWKFHEAVYFSDKNYLYQLPECLSTVVEQRPKMKEKGSIWIEKILLVYVLCEELTSEILMKNMHLFNHLHSMMNDILNSLCTTTSVVITALYGESPGSSKLPLQRETRKQVYSLAMKHSRVGSFGAEQRQRDLANIDALEKQFKGDAVQLERRRRALECAVQLERRWAVSAFSAVLLSAGCDFAEDVFEESGPVISLADKIFNDRHQDARMIADMRQALMNFLCSNPDETESLINLYIRRSYGPSSPIADNFFLTVAQITTANVDLPVSQYTLLLLSLYKSMDRNQKVRAHAAQMLHWMSSRFYRTKDVTYRLFNFSNETSSQTQLLGAAEAFAELHPELLLPLLEETMQIIGSIPEEGQRVFVRFVCPFFHRVDLSRLETESAIYVIYCLTALTSKFGTESSFIPEAWSRMGSVKESDNVEMVLDFLCASFERCQNVEFIDIIRMISKFLMHARPEDVVDHFVKMVSSSEEAANTSNDVTYVDPRRWTRHMPISYLSLDAFYPMPSETTQLVEPRTVACVVLAELVLERPEQWDRHLAVLLHTGCLLLDDERALVFNAAKVLLENALTSIVCNNAAERSPEARAMRRVVAKLQMYDEQRSNVVGSRYDGASSAAEIEELVNEILRALRGIDEGIQDDWSAQALSSMDEKYGDAVTARSLQIYRALRPPIRRFALSQMTERLLRFIGKRGANEVHISMEILSTLHEVVKGTKNLNLAKLPQTFWLPLAMLYTNIPEEYNSSVELLSSLFDVLLQNESQIEGLLSSVPKEWIPPFSGIHSLVMKGLCCKETEEKARKLLIRATSTSLGKLFDSDSNREMLSNAIGLLPRLLASNGWDDAREITEALSKGFRNANNDSAAELMENFGTLSASSEGQKRFLSEISSNIAKHYFPQYALFTIGFLVETVDHGPAEYQRSSIMLVCELIRNIDVSKEPFSSEGIVFVGAILKHLHSELWCEAMELSRVLVTKSEVGEVMFQHKVDVDTIARLSDFQREEKMWGGSLRVHEVFRDLDPESTAILVALEEVYYSFSGQSPPSRIKRGESVFMQTNPRQQNAGSRIGSASAVNLTASFASSKPPENKKPKKKPKKMRKDDPGARSSPSLSRGDKTKRRLSVPAALKATLSRDNDKTSRITDAADRSDSEGDNAMAPTRLPSRSPSPPSTSSSRPSSPPAPVFSNTTPTRPPRRGSHSAGSGIGSLGAAVAAGKPLRSTTAGTAAAAAAAGGGGGGGSGGGGTSAADMATLRRPMAVPTTAEVAAAASALVPPSSAAPRSASSPAPPVSLSSPPASLSSSLSSSPSSALPQSPVRVLPAGALSSPRGGSPRARGRARGSAMGRGVVVGGRGASTIGRGGAADGGRGGAGGGRGRGAASSPALRRTGEGSGRPSSPAPPPPRPRRSSETKK